MEFRIPKQKDRTLIEALITIRDALASVRPTEVQVVPVSGAEYVTLTGTKNDPAPQLKYIFDEETREINYVNA